MPSAIDRFAFVSFCGPAQSWHIKIHEIVRKLAALHQITQAVALASVIFTAQYKWREIIVASVGSHILSASMVLGRGNVTSVEATKFSKLSPSDPFFDSLKAGYKGFPQWFESKANEPVYAVIDDQTDELSGMIYLKQENGPVTDVDPPLADRFWLKVDTLKINGKGTRDRKSTRLNSSP